MLPLGGAAAYALAGMTGFEAVTHAMATVSTGGYSTFDASLGHFANPAIEWVATVFMVLGELPFVIYIQAAHGRSAAVWTNSQIRKDWKSDVWGKSVSVLEESGGRRIINTKKK